MRKIKAGLFVFVLIATTLIAMFGMNATAEATTYTENFDDDTAGADPSGVWYTYWENMDAGSVNATYYNSSPHSFKHDGSVSEDAIFTYFNLTKPVQPDWINISVRTIQATTGNKFWMLFATEHNFSGLASDVATNSTATLGWVEGTLRYYAEGAKITDWTTYTGETWVYVNISFNWTTKQFNINYNGEAMLGWQNFTNTAVNDISRIVFTTPGYNSGIAYIDNIVIHTVNETLPPSPDTPSSSGQPITANDFLTYVFQTNGSMITLKYDILDDTGNMSVLFTSDSYTDSGWHSNGGAGICYDGTYYYIVHRERTGNTYRGRYLTLHRSIDLVNWEQVWRVDRLNFSISTNSVERAVIRYWNHSYYLYFSVADSSDSWKCYYIKSSTPDGLKTLLEDASQWVAITDGGRKDPWVGKVNNTYVMIVTNYVSGYNEIYMANNPEFSGATYSQFTDIKSNTGYISYDNSSGNYICWMSYRNDPDIEWHFYISTDLTTWNEADSWIAISNSAEAGSTGNARYMDYYTYNESNYIIIMEYDYDNDGDLETVLWDYAETASNNIPVCSLSASPTSGDAPLTVTFSMSASDSDGTIASWQLDVDNDGTAEYSGSGTPPATQTHTYNDPGTYTAKLTVTDNDEATAYDIATIMVNASNNNLPNTPDQPSGPTSGYTGSSYTYSTSATDPDGDQIKYGWDWDGDGTVDEWTGYYSSGTTVSISHSWDSTGTYNIKVKAQDSNSAESGWSTALTVTISSPPPSNNPPVLSNPQPANGATDVQLKPDVSIYVSDPDGDTMTITINLTNADGGWQQVSYSGGNGTYGIENLNQHINTTGKTYYWTVTADDGHGGVTTATYHFTTAEGEGGGGIITGGDNSIWVIALIAMFGVIMIAMIAFVGKR